MTKELKREPWQQAGARGPDDVEVWRSGRQSQGAAGMERNTRQRGAIRRAFQRADRPLGTGEVLELARTEVGGLGIATVYRNIRTLVDEGWLAVVELPGEVPRYEVAGKEHHHHFRCRQCDRVYEVPGCVGSLSEIVPEGFVLESHELVLYGRCPECATAA
ncbi:MAG TPA: transcriptional repressor [Gemmatimonadales bacterium]|jgi:Fur family ferric uptake transcriptional regulator